MATIVGYNRLANGIETLPVAWRSAESAYCKLADLKNLMRVRKLIQREQKLPLIQVSTSLLSILVFSLHDTIVGYARLGNGIETLPVAWRSAESAYCKLADLKNLMRVRKLIQREQKLPPIQVSTTEKIKRSTPLKNQIERGANGNGYADMKRSTPKKGDASDRQIQLNPASGSATETLPVAWRSAESIL